MKTAYQYIRISKEDQSHFSISGQQIIIENYAKHNNIKILKTFIDEGYSAKNFNRPQWKELEKELYQNRRSVDMLIVMKYDRLIRYTLAGLQFIEKLEQQWGVRLISVVEDYGVHPDDPEFLSNRLQKLIDAEKERHRISDRTRMGFWSANMQGRYVVRAPFGYNNERDEANKPIITINENEKRMVLQIYSDFLDEVPFPLILKKVRKQGFYLKGHDALKRILSCHLYAGLINTPNYKFQQSKIVEGIHQPIVSKEIFWRAYYKLQDKIRPQGPRIIDDNLPLRGLLLCKVCGHVHSGAKSKGRSAFYYYYRCDKDKQYYNAIKVHDELTEVLAGLSIKKDFLKAIEIEAEKHLEEELKYRTGKLVEVTKEHFLIKKKVETLEEKYISDRIDDATYQKWRPKLDRELNIKSDEINKLSQDKNRFKELLKSSMQYLSDLNWLYNKFDFEGKQALLKSIFLGGLVKEKIGFGTGLLHSIFRENSLKIKHLLQIKGMGELTISANSPISSGDGNQLEPLLAVIDKYINEKAA